MTIGRRQLLLGGALAALSAVAAACRGGPSPSPGTASATPAPASPSPSGSAAATSPPPSATPTAMPTPGPSPTTSPAELRRMIGGLLVVGFRGLAVADTDPVARAIAEDGLGGVVLFDRDQLTGKPRNIASPSQLRDLTASLRALAPDGKLFVAVDQEGGRVARLTPATGFPPTVSEAELGQQDDPDVAFAAGRRTATTLRDAGIDWNFAPVVDLDVNPDNPSIGALGRSFSADPAVVVAMATQVIRAHRELGVLTTLKHYPGLGSATGDTDREFVDVSRTWTPRELGPFRDLVAAGLADSVMAANAFNRQLDASHPASLSHATVTRSLRRDLGFGGPVVTDDLQAGAIRDRYSDADAIELAIAAGCDVLVLANQQVYVAEVARHTIDIVVNLVRRGRVTEHRIAASLERIAAARASIGG